MLRTLILALSLLLFISPLTWAGVEFDSTDDSLSAGSGSTIDNIWASGGTASAWFYSGEDFRNRFFDKSSNGNDTQNEGWNFYESGFDSSGSITIKVGWNSNDGLWRSNGSEYSLNTWTHVAVTYNNGSTGNDPVFYINGSSVTVNEIATPSGSYETDASYTLIIANRASASRAWDGQLTELALWNVALTANEISQLANSRTKRTPLQIQPSNLVAYWPLDEGSDGTANCFNGSAGFKDLSGNNNHATGNDGANNTGLTCKAEEVLSYP